MGLRSEAFTQLLLLEISSFVVRLEKAKHHPPCMACQGKQKSYSLSDPRQEFQPPLGITTPLKVTMSPGDNDRSFRHQPNLKPVTVRIYCLGTLEFCQ